MAQWLNFKELRSRLSFDAVLEHYNVAVTTKGVQRHGFCPLPTHEGKGRSPSFSVNASKNIWHCFGCGAKGNIIEFAMRMENLDPDDGEQFRRAALKLNSLFLNGGERAPKHGGAASKARQENADPESAPSVVVNSALDFELKGLDAQHPYLRERGFDEETIRHFGLGFCTRGSMKGRIAIPLHDAAGKLIGYAGRLIDEQAVDEQNPRYRFPGKRERGGVAYEFHKTAFLYNGHRIMGPVEDLLVVEGFTALWWLWQHGQRSAVALMGASCSDEQAELIAHLVSPQGRVWLLFDGDEAGVRGAQSAAPLLASRRFVRWIRIPRQPTDLTKGDVEQLFSS